MATIIAEMVCIKDEQSETGYFLDWNREYDSYLNEFVYINPFASSALILAIPPQNGMKILVLKKDGLIINKGEQIMGKFKFELRGEEVRFGYRNTRHFNLLPGDKIQFVME